MTGDDGCCMCSSRHLGKMTNVTSPMQHPSLGSGRRTYSSPSVDRAATNASCGTVTEPMFFMRFLPAFCLSLIHI